MSVVRLSDVWETDPVECPPGSEPFLNMALSGITACGPLELMQELHSIEDAVGRRRRRVNDPRVIDLDLIFYGALLSGSRTPALPHPRFADRDFVLSPFRQLGLDWTVGGIRVSSLRGEGRVRQVGPLY